MKIKSTVAGLIIATSMIAVVGTSQAACPYCTTQEGFSGIGWHMVSCNVCTKPAQTWQQYVSGGYSPPIVGSNRLFFWQ